MPTGILANSATIALPAVGDSYIVTKVALATVTLNFFEPLPDDRYTLTIDDGITDPANNALDGETNPPEPQEEPQFPSGDGVPGGDFVARFIIDSRPEIGVWAAGIVHIDTNGNFYFDPENVDFTNRDLVYTLGFSSDYIFAGNFGFAAGGVADGFDKLAVYGRVGDQWRFLIDFDNDGVPDEEFLAPPINGIPVAGNFDGNAANGDEVGIFTGSAWFFDTNHDFVVDDGFATDYAGFPVAGDFDGDGDDDVGTYIASQTGGNFFHIDINTAGLGSSISINGNADHRFRVGLPGLGTFGFPGVRERPVAADMNADGVDDLGLWVPDGTAILPGDQGEWFFLLSDVERVRPEGDIAAFGGGISGETVIDRIISGGVVDFVPFSTTPFGEDLYARFGNSFALPIVGNFDPPKSSGSAMTQHVVHTANATGNPAIPALQQAGSTSIPTTPSTTTIVQPPPAPVAPPATSSTAITTTKFVAPATTAATTKTVTKTTAKSTAKVAKKIAIPVIEAKAKATKTTAPAKTAKTTTKAAAPVAIPKAKSTTKVAKATTTTAKKSTAAPAKPAVAAKEIATPKATVTKAAKKSVAAIKPSTTNVQQYAGATLSGSGTLVVKAGTLTINAANTLASDIGTLTLVANAVEFTSPPVLSFDFAATGEFVSQSLLPSYTVIQSAPLIEPLVLAPWQGVTLIELAPNVVSSTSGGSGIWNSSGASLGFGGVQASTITGTLEMNAGYAVGPAFLDGAGYTLLQQALTDAAFANLQLTRADVTTNAADVATNGNATADSAHDLALNLAWGSA